jgi:hypothetical protein
VDGHPRTSSGTVPAWPYQAVDDTRSCTIVSSKRDLGDLGARFISSLSPPLGTRVRFGRVSDTRDTPTALSIPRTVRHRTAARTCPEDIRGSPRHRQSAGVGRPGRGRDGRRSAGKPDPSTRPRCAHGKLATKA